jgi:hypothetical protein
LSSSLTTDLWHFSANQHDYSLLPFIAFSTSISIAISQCEGKPVKPKKSLKTKIPGKLKD